jgi:adenylylsulfate kinase-like enzyme
MVRDLLDDGEFVEVFVDTPLEICEQRDPKGLYRRARAGEIANFTGIDSEYQAPEAPEIHIRTTEVNPEQAVELLLSRLEERGVLQASLG